MIKESLEVLDAVNAEADAIIKSCADGKLTLLDLRYQMPVIAKARAAFVGIDKVKGEIQNASTAEVEQLLTATYNTGLKMVEAFEAIARVLNKE
jgi:hypothetical protein